MSVEPFVSVEFEVYGKVQGKRKKFPEPNWIKSLDFMLGSNRKNNEMLI